MLTRFGDIADLSLAAIPREPLRPTEVRVRVAVAGLNPVDWQIVESPELASAFGLDVPMGYGNDFSGTIVEVGPAVRSRQVGDRVFGGARGRAAASTITLDEEHPGLHRTPTGVSDLQAGVLDIAGRTASAVVDALAARRGETTLVGAAGGGVGSILTQLLVREGIEVLGSGSPASFDFIRSLGARPVPYGDDLTASVRAEGVVLAAAADLHGTATAEAAVLLGVPPRRVVTIEAEHPPTGTVQVNGSDAQPGALDRLLALVVNGELQIPVAATYSLDRFREAIAVQRSRHVRGKIALVLTESDCG
ncbi:alcohol dehydrogenase catalytic domain-containing protein [Curtobacterium luteum]|uniref:alcohol dehydrogenase catalytic domain-containing protein n=1 Tax=Curtobacterium luteum TaxID=33881 RepID=UPI0038056BBA